MRCLLLTVVFAAASLMADPAPGQDARPDFHLLLEKCKTTVVYLVLSDESLKTVDGEPVYDACTRKSRQIACAVTFLGGGKSLNSKTQTVDYSVVLDSPPLLHFADERYADYFAVNLSEHSVVLVSRVLFEKGLGPKVCHGLFATDDEMKALGQRKPAR